MASELRVNKINSRTGFGTITVSETGQDLVGITTIENLTTENTLVGAAASFTGNVQVGGVLTYEDVTNIDSVGLVTARTGIEIGARPGVAASISVDGNMIISGITTLGTTSFTADATINSVKVGKGANSATANTVLGELALDASVTGTNNTAIGYQALTELTTGVQNTAVGTQSLDACTTGTRNTGLGAFALGATTTGDYNVAVGKGALEANTTADSNTACGYEALALNTTGAKNTAVGGYALDANTTGDKKDAIG